MPGSAPSSAQIALALLVLKSKPASQSVEEYIYQIRSVVLGQTRRHPVSSSQYIDGTLFWKRACEKLEDDNEKLRSRVFDLERASENNMDIEHRLSSPDHIKRKAEKLSPTKANMQTKRRKPITQGNDRDRQNEMVGHDVKSNYSACSHLLRAHFALNFAIRNTTSGTGKLYQSVQATVRIVEVFLHKYRWGTDQSLIPATAKIDPESCSKAVRNLWHCMLDAIKRIEQLDSRDYTKCIPEMVRLFQVLLGQIQQYCLDEADKQLKCKKRRKSKIQSQTTMNKDSGSSLQIWARACQNMTATLRQMLGLLTLGSEACCLLLEGILCAILDHVGSSMSLLVFAEPGVDIKEQEGLSPPQGLLDVAHIDSDTAIATCQLAAPYLVAILQSGMATIDNMDDMQRQRMLGVDQLANDDNLYAKLQQKLQKTLLRGVYGDDDLSFKNALNRSTESELADINKLLSSIAQEKDKSEWFIGQIWEQLGWDVLVAD